MLQIFFVVLAVFFLFLNSHNITCQICTYSSSILEEWDYKLNYDVRSFTNKIKNVWWRHSLIREFPVALKTLGVWNALLQVAFKENFK